MYPLNPITHGNPALKIGTFSAHAMLLTRHLLPAIPGGRSLTGVRQPLSPEKWARAREIYARLMDTPETERPALMQNLCQGERDIESELQGLLSAHEKAGDFLLGCLIGQMSLELSGSSERVRAELLRILDRWDEALTACVRSGQGGSGGVRADLDAAQLASLLIEAWEGAALRGKVTRSRTPYDRFEAVTVPALLG